VSEQEPSGFHCIDEALSTIANPGSVRTLTALTVLKTRYATKWNALTLSTGSQVSCALTAASERGPSTWHRPLIERPIVSSGADDCMRDARHLGGDGGDRLAAEMLVVGILGNVAAIARLE
jgi:hypothetical protein